MVDSKPQETILRSYKVTVDSGYAPNPYAKVLSLAICKPLLRETAEIGSWVAGFTSKELDESPVGEEKLLFLMKIEEKLTFDEYYKAFPDKRQKKCVTGDNIYYKDPKNSDTYIQVPNPAHNDTDDKEHDLKSEYVILSREKFYYFGKNAIEIPPQKRPTIPTGPAARGWKTEGAQADQFIRFVEEQAQKLEQIRPNVYGEPHAPLVSASQTCECSACHVAPQKHCHC